MISNVTFITFLCGQSYDCSVIKYLKQDHFKQIVWGLWRSCSCLSANGDFAPPFCFMRFCPRFLKTKLKFATEGVNGVKYVEKDRYTLCDFALLLTLSTLLNPSNL
jgi:hypothetical protein